MHGSCLRKLNTQRKNGKETQLDENHAHIYSLKNKSSWKIDGETFDLICHFSALILHMRNILVDMFFPGVFRIKLVHPTCQIHQFFVVICQSGCPVLQPFTP